MLFNGLYGVVAEDEQQENSEIPEISRLHIYYIELHM